MQLPFERLNLRRNPFGELRLEERPALAVIDPGPLLAHLEPERAALQLLGDKGRGKTTHLLTLRSVRPAPYVHLPEDGPLPAVPLDAPLLYLDESQRLPWRVRRRLFRGEGRLVLGTHEDHTRALERAGRPVVTMHAGAGLDLARLTEIVSRRIEAARRGPGPLPWIPEASLRALLARFGDDLRGMERHLYDRVQRQEAVGPIEVE
ncbi:MAG: hypothetical protein KDD82_11145 [Planctomycetes bacterium]|nr:hypothetical protein [Planctomycetota bacterium]